MRVLTLTAAALLLAAACGADKGFYVRQNERILETLPEVPGGQRLEVEHNPYYEDWVGPPIGYTTNVIYGAPPAMTDDEVVEFYVLSMSEDWEAKVEEIPILEGVAGEQVGRVLLVGFTRGTAFVGVNTDNMYAGGPRTFEVSINYRGAR